MTDTDIKEQIDNKIKSVKNQKALAVDRVKLDEISGNETLQQLGFENTDEGIANFGLIFPNSDAEEYDCYDYLMSSCPDISSAMQIRTNAILQTEYDILSNGTDKADLYAVDMIKDVFKSILKINFVSQDLLDALLKGFSVVETNWMMDGNLFIPYQAHKKNQNHFKFFNEKGQNVIRWMDKIGGDTQQGEVLPQEKFIIHQHLASYENPYGISILNIKLMVLAFIISETKKAMMRFQDRFGIPYTVIELNEKLFTDATKKKIAEDSIKEGYKVNGIVIQEGTNLRLEQANKGNVSGFLDTLRYCSNQISLDILGQSTTSDDGGGGSYAKSKVASQISQTVINADIEELKETYDNLAKKICVLNGLNLTIYPYIKFKTDLEDDIKTQIEVTERLYNIGLQLNKSATANQYGIEYDPNTPEDELLIKSDNTQPQLPFSQQFSKKKSDVLEFAQSKKDIAEKEWILIDRWFNEGSKDIVKTFKPIWDDIINEASKLTSKTLKNLTKYKANPEKLNRLTNKYFNYLGWINLYGMSSMYRDAGSGLYSAGRDDGVLLFYNSPLEFQTIDIDYNLEQLTYNEALEYFSTKTPMLVNDMIALEQPLRAKAFWLAKSNTEMATERVQRAIVDGISEGFGVDEWIRANTDTLNNLGFVNLPSQDITASYMRMVYRTNVSNSFQAGRWQTSQNETVKKLMPYYMYIAVGDDNTRPNHMAYDGKVYAANDPIWNTIYPLNGYQCRCTVILLSDKQLVDGGYAVEQRGKRQLIDGQKMLPDKGWSGNQAKDWLSFRG